MSIFGSDKENTPEHVKLLKEDIIQEVMDNDFLLDAYILKEEKEFYDLLIVKPTSVLAKKRIGQYEDDVPRKYQQVFYIKIFEGKRECNEWKTPEQMSAHLHNHWITDYIVSHSPFAIIHRIKAHTL